MSLAEWFGWGGSTPVTELPDIFPLTVTQTEFIKTDIVSIYSKILTDVLERTHGLSDDQVSLMWDNCVKSNSSDGLITLLSQSMADKTELFLVYEKAVKVIRVATRDEEVKIREDYAKSAASKTGVFISFKNFSRSDMVKLYLALEYCTVASLHKAMNLSKAVQLKMNDLRASVSLADSADVKAQAKEIARALSLGKDVLLDAKDAIETNAPDLTAVKESVSFLIQKISFYLGLPEAYLIGEQTGGLGTTGENDTRAIERGLKAYYFSIMKPTLEALLGTSVSYKSQDFRQIAGSMEVIKTFSLIDESLISLENKQKIINQMLDLPEDAEGDELPEPKVDPKADPNEKANPKTD